MRCSPTSRCPARTDSRSCRAYAANGSIAATPAAALTALGAEHRDRILAAGYQMYIPKPVVPPLLAAAVRDLARRRTISR